MSNDLLLSIVRQKFKQTQSQLDEVVDDLDFLNEKTERAGETDGFRDYTVATLPFAIDGINETRFAYITDGLDFGETTGNGTGCLAVYKPGLDKWRTIYDNTDVVS